MVRNRWAIEAQRPAASGGGQCTLVVSRERGDRVVVYFHGTMQCAAELDETTGRQLTDALANALDRVAV